MSSLTEAYGGEQDHAIIPSIVDTTDHGYLEDVANSIAEF